MEKNTKSQSAKVQDVLNRLAKLDECKQANVQSNKVKQEVKTEEQQTVSDDFNVEEKAKQQILHYEEIIRKTLELFDINYDEMIRMDGKSAYNKAVQFYPHLLDEVKKSTCPPLTALNIAKKMQPYMEFTKKYGSSIEDIKQSLKNEVADENNAEKSAKLKVKQQPAKPVQQASVFSDVGNAITQNTKPKEKQDETLASFFAR